MTTPTIYGMGAHSPTSIDYLKLLWQEVGASGLEVKPAWPCWQRYTSSHYGDVLHLHFPENLYHSKFRLVRLLRMIRLLVDLTLWRLLGRRIVLTVHNLVPHRGATESDILFAGLLPRLLNHYIVMYPEAVPRVEAQYAFFKRVPHTIVPHPLYPRSKPGRTNDLAKKIQDDPRATFLVLGQQRQNKGLHLVAKLFLHDEMLRFATLAIVGKQTSREIDGIEAATYYWNQHIDSQDLAAVVDACQAVLLPYDQGVLHSGAALLALAHSKPILTSLNPHFLYLRSVVGSTWVDADDVWTSERLLNFAQRAHDLPDSLPEVPGWHWRVAGQRHAKLYKAIASRHGRRSDQSEGNSS